VDSSRAASAQAQRAGAADSSRAAPSPAHGDGPDSLTARGGAARDTLQEPAGAVAAGAARPVTPPPWGRADRPDRPFPILQDTLPALPTTTPLVPRGGAFDLPDSVLGQKPSAYRVHMTPDYAGGDVIAATGYGFAGSTQIDFSDFLGNHNLYIATDLFGGSLEETNALALYSYLPRRWDFGAGLFHFKNYYSARITTLGEQLGSPRLFSERTFGGLLEASYPFDRFHRTDLNMIQMFVERKFFDEDVLGDIVETGRQYRSVTSPSLSFVGDNALFGYYGPVNGQRYNLTWSPALPWFSNALAYQTVTFDARRYWDLTHGYTFAGRVLAGRSSGRDAQTFQVGGFSTLRGFDAHEVLLQGSRLAVLNAEVRFPFIQQLGLVGPVPLGVFNLRGALFCDAGMVWNEGETLRLTHVFDGKRRLATPKMGFGVGIRTAFAFAILKLDTAWNTDLAGVSKPRWHFSIGPEF
jgi:outer membrane protein assembly factor BamA